MNKCNLFGGVFSGMNNCRLCKCIVCCCNMHLFRVSSVKLRRLISATEAMHLPDPSKLYDNIKRANSVRNMWKIKYWEALGCGTVEKFMEHMELWFRMKVERMKKFRVVLRDGNDEISFCPPIRFSDQYAKRTAYRVYPLSDLFVHSFWTLTFRGFGGMSASPHDYFNKMRGVSKAWGQFRAYVAKMGIKIDYIRSYEVSKSGMLHIHVGVYTLMSNAEVEKLYRYWHYKFGWVKVFIFTGDTSYYSFFIDDVLEWREDNKRKSDKMNVGYIWKYMLKPPSIRDMAILSWFRVRSYSASFGLRSFLRKWESRTSAEFVRYYYEEEE